MDKLFLDYTKTKQDAEILKQFLISQVHRFTDAKDMERYIIGECPYYVSEGKDFWSDVWKEIAKQNGKQYISQVENSQWIIEYLNYIADHDFSIVCNAGLNTRKRKVMDREAFYNYYVLQS
jgi:hypothetical protein